MHVNFTAWRRYDVKPGASQEYSNIWQTVDYICSMSQVPSIAQYHVYVFIIEQNVRFFFKRPNFKI